MPAQNPGIGNRYCEKTHTRKHTVTQLSFASIARYVKHSSTVWTLQYELHTYVTINHFMRACVTSKVKDWTSGSKKFLQIHSTHTAMLHTIHLKSEQYVLTFCKSVKFCVFHQKKKKKIKKKKNQKKRK